MLTLVPFLPTLMVAALTVADGVAWETDYDAAFVHAKERAVPILLAFNMDAEVANDDTLKQVYQDAEFIKRSKDFVCLIASVSSHAPKDGGDHPVCSRFGAVTCEQHQKIDIKARAEYVGKDTAIAPQHVLISPDRFVLARKAYFASKSELLDLMTLAEKAVRRGTGSGGASPDAARVKDLVVGAQDRNAERRRPAIAELGRFASPDARKALFELCDPTHMDVTRVDAIDALATRGNYDALPIVLALTKDKSVQVVKHAIVALEKLELPDAVPPLLKLWRARPKATVGREIIRALASCGKTNAEVQDVVRKATSSDDTVVEQSAIIALTSLPPDAATNEVLAKKLADRNSNVRGLAVYSIGKLRIPALKATLKERLPDESDTNVRSAIEIALAAYDFTGKGDEPRLYGLSGRFLEEDVTR